MFRYRLRVALLTLGVVVGYGSALAHAFGHGPVFARHGHHHQHHHCAWE